MGQHKVSFHAPGFLLGKTDIELRVWKNNAVVGIMKISRGNLVWVPRDGRKGYRVNWGELDKLMREGGHKLK